MAYTTYPAEAATFAEEAGLLSSELQDVKSNLNISNNAFSIDDNEDYLTLKTLEANMKIQGIIDSGCQIIENDVSKVSARANELEEEECERQKALEIEQNQDKNG